MTAVYSTLFISAKAATGFLASHTFPAGYVAIVRDISGEVGGGSETAGYTAVERGTGCIFALENFGTAFYGFQWQGRQVFAAGSILDINLFGGAECSVRVSGYLLELP